MKAKTLLERSKMHICCICGKEYEGYGNNPYPVGWDVFSEEDRCCNECNMKYVIPARIARLSEREAR